MMKQDALEAMIKLHTDSMDAINGYREATKDADGGGLTPVFERMIAVHSTNASELSFTLLNSGVIADDSGSFMSDVHRTIMKARSWFGGLDETVLPGMIDGEERNAGHISDAIESVEFPADIKALLGRQRDRLEREILALRAQKVADERN